MSKSWYLMRYKNGQLDKLAMHLKRLDISFLLPMSSLVHRKENLHPSFCEERDYFLSPYIFIQCDFEDVAFSTIKNLPGSNGFVLCGNTLESIPGRIMDSILKLKYCEFNKELQ